MHGWQDSLALLAMAVVSLALGAALNLARESPLAWVYVPKAERMEEAVLRLKADEAVNQAGDQELAGDSLPAAVGLAEALDFQKNGSGVILDARPGLFYEMGHIPGAFSLPREDFEDAYRKLASGPLVHKNQPLMIYCSSPSCEDSGLVEKALRDLGYTSIVVFEGGWEAWIGAGLPEAR